jgi:hypothetical protein
MTLFKAVYGQRKENLIVKEKKLKILSLFLATTMALALFKAAYVYV